MWLDGLADFNGCVDWWIPLRSAPTSDLGREIFVLTISSGYDTGVISSVLVMIKEDLGHTLSSSEKEMVTSLTSGGALVGAIAAGMTADKCE